MMKKKLLLLSPALLVLLLSGCGTGGDGGGSTPQNNSTTTSSSVNDASSSEAETSSVSSENQTSSSSSEDSSSSEEPAGLSIKQELSKLLAITKQSPYSYIPETLRETNDDNYVESSEVTYDFTTSTNVSAIKYGGFGEQWHMVIENIHESQRFYSILSAAETAIDASITIFKNKLSDTDTTVNDSTDETNYKASVKLVGSVLKYTFQYKTGSSNAYFGDITPQVDMTYNISTKERTARVQLTSTNAMKYKITDEKYEFAIQYGITAVSRKAFFSIQKDSNNNLEGHIYEFVQYKDKDLVPSCADFYINGQYLSVVGNKASGMPGFTGYINELYKVDEGKLLGYEVRETFTKWGVSATYHTLWFNLNNITGINAVKAVENGSSTYGLGGQNPHDIYLNGSSDLFVPTYNKKLTVDTSRKYDVELRKQYFYGLDGDDKLVEYEVKIPMMFIQADHDSYTNYSDFPANILAKSGITASVNLSAAYLSKIQSDYATLIDVFIQNKESVTGASITTYIGSAEVI